MKKLVVLFSILTSFGVTHAQQVEGTELGVEGNFHASTNGGTLGLGLKYGMKLSENLIVGPSLRYQRFWVSNNVAGTSASYNVFGGGGFAHLRFFNALFAGAELEFMRTPFNANGFISPTQKSWAPTLFIGGGFSMEFNESWRLNAGIMYDIIDHVQSPLRQQYFLRNSQNVLLPVIYRINFFFPLS